MSLKIELNKSQSNITWDDLGYGDVFETDDGIAMKVFDDSNGIDYILFFDDFNMYADVENYSIIRKINCKLVEE